MVIRGLLAAVALLVLASCSSSSSSKAPGTSAVPKTRYDMANGCYAMQSVATGAFVTRSGDGYSASAGSLEEAEPFSMKPTALGRYLFNCPDSNLLVAGSSSAARAAKPSDAADWVVDDADGGGYTVVQQVDGRGLSADADGTLLVGEAADAFRFVPTTGCTSYPEISDDVDGDTYQGNGVDQPVVGFAEVHTHMAMGNEMSDGTNPVGPSAGGVLYGQMFNRFGAPVALDNCAAMHGPNGTLDPEALILDMTPLKTHDTQGWPTFADWPAYDSQLHQAMYYKWVERAWKAGLRIMVSEGTNIAALCQVAKTFETATNPQALGYDCNDMNLGIAQIKYLYQLQDYVDAQEGGPGKGWFRIVKSPAEARKVINDGKLAVVPGLEFSNLFDCTTKSVAGVTGEISGCTKEDIDKQVDEIWDLGVREIFPYHDVNSALGGTGIFDGLALNLVGFVGTGSFWKTYDCPDGGEGDSYFYSAGAYMTTAIPGTGNDPLTQTVLALTNGVLPIYPADRRQCNARGMTELGHYVVQKLMEKHFIIDIDHAELSIKQNMLDMAKAQTPNYPLISAHGGHGGITNEQAREILEVGGLIYPFKPNGKGDVEFLNKLKPIWAAAGRTDPIAVGYGMDANGIADRAGPRGAGSEPVVYPFTLFKGPDWGPQFKGIKPVTFELETIPESGKTWNIDEVGTAHYGLVADYVEEVRLEGGKEALDALYQSAEAYLQMWERTVNR
ncbi:peptidase M19 [Solimonas sp. C16B3]|uniref:Peptidase M19 n=1 Tax=Solimonas marina TaxID=2714601 RepID=A0A969WFN9_9GAMM|nr:peptidase M19 [Solimonas marina]